MLHIEPSILRSLIANVEPYPEECCGFFLGHVGATSCTITKSMAMNNSTAGNKQTNFEITSKDYLYTESIAEEENLALLGVYHSHLNHPAVPSEVDRLAAMPNFSYIIISVMDRKFDSIRSWQLDTHSQFQEEKIIIDSLI